MENSFLQNITNEDASALPAVQFTGRIVVVDDQRHVKAACADLLSHKVIGFDTETRPTFRPGALNRVALLQLSTPECCYLFRLCRIPLERDIIKVLESRTTTKIGADIGNDIKALQQLRHFEPRAFVDLQSIASGWGIAEKSVRKLSGIVLGARVSKAQRLSNWESTTLTMAQQIYAATDAWVCIEIYERLLLTEQRPLPKPAPSPSKKEKESEDKSEVKSRRRKSEASGKKRYRPRRRKSSAGASTSGSESPSNTNEANTSK